MRAVAARNPDTLVIGVDATAEGLRDASRRLAAKASRGGLPNSLLGRLSLADAPGELAGLADSLTVLLPWGSLLAAVARPNEAALRSLRALCKAGAQVRVLFGYGVEPEGAAALRAALSAGQPVPVELRTIADGLAAPFAGEHSLAVARDRVDEVVLVSEEEIEDGFRFLYGRAKLACEPAGAASTAALLAGKITLQPGETVVAVVSGGNAAPETASAILARQ